MKFTIDGPDQILYQWDKGQRLQLHWAKPGTRVDFARCAENKAVSKYAYTEDGAVFCDIPDALLMEPTHLHGYVYLTDGERGKTVHEFLIPVIRRPKPEDYVEPEEVLTWHELENRLDQAEQEIEELKENGPTIGKEHAGKVVYVSEDGTLTPLSLDPHMSIEDGVLKVDQFEAAYLQSPDGSVTLRFGYRSEIEADKKEHGLIEIRSQV